MLVEVSPLCDFLRAVKPTGAYVESDGKDGTAKVVVTGTDAGVGIIDAAIPMGGTDLSVKQEYILEENSSAIKIVTSVTNLAGDTTIKMGDGAFWLRRARTLVPGVGYGDDAVMGREMKYIVVIGDGLAYGYVVPTGAFKIPIAQATSFRFTAKRSKRNPTFRFRSFDTSSSGRPWTKLCRKCIKYAARNSEPSKLP
jgi:hypothetical protein